ncbi:hypothetical protein [Saccharibacillus kuerlensis]|uniref:Uncharacterized protein n=1 Tax=Saccharibacillus kuerlensis TaxID=459527 RepID=A0ABQ2L9J5_9BACL|nr:hypothetical protein [Saccharibacillus kuerlensis]GGO07730.1 hypothetical protein GCM10010969_36440 [Saccharibacillus kuerlensis]
MLTIMMLLTGMLSSLSNQDYSPSYAATVPHVMGASSIYHAAYAQTLPEQVQTPIYPAKSGFETLNGLTLQSRIEDANKLYGEPFERVPAYMAGEEHRYDGLSVGAYEDWIYYVSVPAEAGVFNLNGHELPMEIREIRARLGEPDFTADDGFGYEHQGQALKIFVDSSSGKVRSVELFDSTSV